MMDSFLPDHHSEPDPLPEQSASDERKPKVWEVITLIGLIIAGVILYRNRDEPQSENPVPDSAADTEPEQQPEGEPGLVLLRTYELPGVQAWAMSPNGEFIACQFEDKVVVRESASEQEVASFPVNTPGPPVRFIDDDHLCVSGDIYHFRTRRRIGSTPSGPLVLGTPSLFLSGGQYGVHAINVSTGETKVLTHEPVYSMAYGSRRNELAILREDGRIDILQLPSGVILRTVPVPPGSQFHRQNDPYMKMTPEAIRQATQLAFSRDGTKLAGLFITGFTKFSEPTGAYQVPQTGFYLLEGTWKSLRQDIQGVAVPNTFGPSESGGWYAAFKVPVSWEKWFKWEERLADQTTSNRVVHFTPDTIRFLNLGTNDSYPSLSNPVWRSDHLLLDHTAGKMRVFGVSTYAGDWVEPQVSITMTNSRLTAQAGDSMELKVTVSANQPLGKVWGQVLGLSEDITGPRMIVFPMIHAKPVTQTVRYQIPIHTPAESTDLKFRFFKNGNELISENDGLLVIDKAPAVMTSFTIRDDGTGNSQGNGNGKANSGEVVDILTRLENPTGKPIRSPQATLVIVGAEGGITVLESGQAFPSTIETGQSGVCRLSFRVGEVLKPHTILFEVVVKAADQGGIAGQRTLAIMPVEIEAAK